MNRTEANLSTRPAKSKSSRLPMIWFATTILLGAFLVFQVQPVISKCVLPWFGGTSAVWTTCMLFFQVLLFAGYLYAHILKSYFGPPAQGAIHLVLLGAAAFCLPIEPSAAWKPTGAESPTLHLLWMLLCHVGLPYFVLSCTGPLVQAWLSYHDSSDGVYRLYALSNAGSLLALLSYPFLVEPFLSVSNQSVLWSLAFCVFILIQGIVAIRLFRVSSKRGPIATETAAMESLGIAPVQPFDRFLWLALPALASTVLLVVTTHACQNVAVIPFLWVLPLSLYLISFIICFDSPVWYKPKWIAAMTMVAIVAIQTNGFLPVAAELIAEVSCYMVLLLGICLLCHGEVARLKPPARFLTQYYAFLSAGGALGGIIVAIVCPMLFNTYAELPLCLSIVSAFSFVIFMACRNWRVAKYDWVVASPVKFGVVLMMIAPPISVTLAGQEKTIASDRNFFGVLKVTEGNDGLQLVHGSTVHGMQRRGDAAGEPTSYYGHESGVGLVMEAIQQEKSSLKIAVIGLGCGVLASYGREADEFDMVEINPAVQRIANQYFTFMRDCPSTIRHHLGDGRLVLERMTDARFDVLVLDAFSSDAIPAHLLTTEAFDLYQRRLSNDAVLVVHVSNNHLDLVSLVHRQSANVHLESRLIEDDGDRANFTQKSTWMVIAERTHPIWKHDSFANTKSATIEEQKNAPLWTDQHHNLVSVLKWW